MIHGTLYFIEQRQCGHYALPLLQCLCREEKLRRAKQRKREWLLKMYRAQVGAGMALPQLLCSV